MTSQEKTRFRATVKWKSWRKYLIAKAGKACELCGTEYKGARLKMLQIHHIYPMEYKDLREFDDKGKQRFACLCADCHSVIEKFAIKKSWGQYKDKWHSLLDDFMPRL